MKSAAISRSSRGDRTDKSTMKGDDIAARFEDFGAAVIKLVRDLPRDRAGRLISDQLLRSATAGGSNYEEARSAQSRRDFIHKVSLGAKEMREAIYWLALVAKTEPSMREIATGLRKEGNELVAILMKSARTARAAEQSTAERR
jgi:four helix bundle protein